MEAFNPKLTILQVKKQFLQHYQQIYSDQFSFEDDEEAEEKVHKAIEIYVRDNLPLVKKNKKSSMMERAQCEFCGSKHGPNDEFCDLKIDGVDANTIEGG